MTLTKEQEDFINESNRIENIHRPYSQAEADEFMRFMALETVTLADLQEFVSVYQPNARLRELKGMDVRVGNYHPPEGGLYITESLIRLLRHMNKFPAYHNHHKYETLHPYSDCNGRSGRMLWLWQMRSAPMGFLRTWYYQSLDDGGRKW